MRLILPVTALLTVISHAAGLDALIGEFQADRRDLSNSPAVSWTPDSREREDALLTTWEKRLDTLDYDSLDPTARIDWHLLRTSLQERRDDIVLQRKRFQEIEPLLAFSPPLQALTTALSNHQLADAAKSAGVLAKASADVKDLRKKLEAGHAKDAPADSLKPTPVIALRTADAIEELRTSLENWYSLYDGFQPDFTWWNRQPYGSLTADLNGLKEHTAQRQATGPTTRATP